MPRVWADNLGKGAVESVNGRTGAIMLAKSDVGLGNVDNTSDASKPVSTAQQTALNAKADLNTPTFTGTGIVVPSSSGTTPNVRIQNVQTGIFGSHSAAPKRFGFKLGAVVILDSEFYGIGSGASRFQSVPLRAEAGFTSGMQEVIDLDAVSPTLGGKVVADNTSGPVTLYNAEDLSDPVVFDQLGGLELTLVDFYGMATANPIAFDFGYPLPTGETIATIDTDGGYVRLIVGDSQWLLAGSQGASFT